MEVEKMLSIKKRIMLDDGFEHPTSYNIRYDVDRSLIWIKVRGILTVTIWRQMVIDAIKAASDHKCKNLLYDVTDAIIKGSTFEIYEIAAHLSDFGLERSKRTAFVHENNEIDLQFFENVAINRGFAVRFFTSTNEAISWVNGN